MENSLWKRLWTCLKADYEMMIMMLKMRMTMATGIVGWLIYTVVG